MWISSADDIAYSGIELADLKGALNSVFAVVAAKNQQDIDGLFKIRNASENKSVYVRKILFLFFRMSIETVYCAFNFSGQIVSNKIDLFVCGSSVGQIAETVDLSSVKINYVLEKFRYMGRGLRISASLSVT